MPNFAEFNSLMYMRTVMPAEGFSGLTVS